MITNYSKFLIFSSRMDRRNISGRRRNHLRSVLHFKRNTTGDVDVERKSGHEVYHRRHIKIGDRIAGK